MERGVDYFKEAWLKRRAQFSTVAIIKSSDPKRLDEFIKFIDGVYRTSNKSFKIYLYKVWSGLFEITVDKDRVFYKPVNIQFSSSSISSLAYIGSGQIRDINQALFYLDNVMMSNERVIVVLWGLFNYKNVSDAEHYALVKFLRNAIFDENYYVKYHFIVLFTDYPELLLDDDTLKHSIIVDLPASTYIERFELIKNIIENLGVSVNNLDVYAEALKGLNLHEVESVVLESIYKYKSLDLSAMISYKYDIVKKTGLLDIETPDHGFEAVGGYDVLKNFIINNVIRVLKNPHKATRLGLRPPRGILLFGPPGTGKTWFARALAKELQLPFLRLRTERIVSMWYGETSRNLAKALSISESISPCVLFIDEIDRFGRRGGLFEHEETRRSFSILLEWLGDERRKTIVIGTTNRIEDLDEAFRRVGRFDYIIPMLYPDYTARFEILKVHTSVVRRVPLASDVDLELIARETEYWSGAELQELVLRAARKALSEDSDVVSMKHFISALETFKVNINERSEQLKKYLKLAEEYTNDTEFLEQLKKTYTTRIEAIKQF